MLQNKKPEIIVFAGPNGSGKSTISELAKTIDPFINADEIKRVSLCSDLEAAKMAEALRENLVSQKKSFTFETVLSTERNIKLLRRAKENGYFIRAIYILTHDPQINITRVETRVEDGGHDVPIDKIVSRYYKALKLVPGLVEICDICHIYDNSYEPFRIFKKRKDQYFYWENSFWDKEGIEKLTGTQIKSV